MEAIAVEQAHAISLDRDFPLVLPGRGEAHQALGAVEREQSVLLLISLIRPERHQFLDEGLLQMSRLRDFGHRKLEQGARRIEQRRPTPRVGL